VCSHPSVLLIGIPVLKFFFENDTVFGEIKERKCVFLPCYFKKKIIKKKNERDGWFNA